MLFYEFVYGKVKINPFLCFLVFCFTKKVFWDLHVGPLQVFIGTNVLGQS